MLLSLRRRVRFHHKLFRSLALLQRFSVQNLEKSFRECFNSHYEMNDSVFRNLKCCFMCILHFRNLFRPVEKQYKRDVGADRSKCCFRLGAVHTFIVIAPEA